MGKFADAAGEKFGPEGEWWSGCVGRCTGKYLRGEDCDVDEFGDCTKKYGKCFGKCNRQLGNRVARSFNRKYRPPREPVTTFTEDVYAIGKKGKIKAAEVGAKIYNEVAKGVAKGVDVLREGLDFYEEEVEEVEEEEEKKNYPKTAQQYYDEHEYYGSQSFRYEDVVGGYNNTADNNFILAGFL